MKIISKVCQSILNIFFTILILGGLSLGILYFMGMTPYIVMSGSMEPEIHTGSLAFVDKKYAYDDVKEGDIIAFEVESGALVTHRALSITNEGIETKGDNNDVTDGISTNASNFRGLTRFYIPYIGYLIAWVGTKRGIIISVTLVASLLIADFILSSDDEEDKKKKKSKKEAEVESVSESNEEKVEVKEETVENITKEE